MFKTNNFPMFHNTSIYGILALRQHKLNSVVAETVGIKPFVTDYVKWLLVAHFAEQSRQQEQLVKAAIAKGQLDQARKRTQELKPMIKAAIAAGDEDKARLLYKEFLTFANVVAESGKRLSE